MTVLYSRIYTSANKVKSDVSANLIMVFRIEGITLIILYDHPLATEKGGHLYGFVISKLHALPPVSLFQPLHVIIITDDVAVGKSGIQRSPMYSLGNFFVRLKLFLDWTPPLFLFGNI